MCVGFTLPFKINEYLSFLPKHFFDTFAMRCEERWSYMDRSEKEDTGQWKEGKRAQA